MKKKTLKAKRCSHVIGGSRQKGGGIGHRKDRTGKRQMPMIPLS